ncbi:MAG: hypothetical protein WCD70_12250 [Alphaproteobacteria bacterium]
MPTHDEPHTIIDIKISASGIEYDDCLLVYQGKRLSLSPTEYAIAKSMLSPRTPSSPGGLDSTDVDEERLSIRRKDEKKPLCEFISSIALTCALNTLRVKVDEAFGGALKVPSRRHMIGATPPKGLRFWKKEEWDEVYLRLESPGKEGPVIIQEPNLLWHVFIDGKEVKSDGRAGLATLDCEIIIRAYSANGFCRHAPEFKAVCAALTGQEEIPDEAFFTRLQKLRPALKSAGLELTSGQQIRKDHCLPLEQKYRITPMRSKSKDGTPSHEHSVRVAESAHP